MDSGASQHMTGRIDLVDDIEPPLPQHSRVKIGDNRELKVLGQGNVVVAREVSIKNVLVVESLGYNLLSIYQLSKCGYGCYFDDESVIITAKSSLKVVFVGHVKFDMYVLDFSNESTSTATCLTDKVDVGWLWNR